MNGILLLGVLAGCSAFETPSIAMPAVRFMADQCWGLSCALGVSPLALDSDVRVAPSRGRGDGLFATRSLAPGEMVGRYEGIMRNDRDHRAMCRRGEAAGDYAFNIPETDWLVGGADPAQSGLVRYVNHSVRRANCEAGSLSLFGRAYGIYGVRPRMILFSRLASACGCSDFRLLLRVLCTSRTSMRIASRGRDGGACDAAIQFPLSNLSPLARR
jgi:hypothetical protein